MNFVFLFAMLFASPVFAVDVGFKNGNDIELTTLRGQVNVNCPMGAWRVYNCYGEIVEPGNSDRIKTSEPVDADKVSLMVRKNNGKQVEKSEKYKSSKMESGNFNLTINTLTQNPLLQLGKNTVNYSFTKDNQVVLEGSFEANFELVEERICPYKTIFAASPYDCDNYSAACNYYFNSLDNCF